MLWKVDLHPFSRFLTHKLDAIMPAHVVYHTFEDTFKDTCDDKLTGFSPYWLQIVLREQFTFIGIIISDNLTMEEGCYLLWVGIPTKPVKH